MSTIGDAGNGASHPTAPQPHISHALGDHGRQIQHDAEVLAATVREATGGVQRYLATQAEQRPFSTVSVAAGVGYVLGGGLSSRLAVLLLGAATRIAAALVARELSSRIVQNDPPSTNGPSA